jgi:hypothetical protein
MKGSSLCRALGLAGLVLFLSIANLIAMQGDPVTEHEHHMAEMKEHGTEAMGFDQDKTAHHFFLRKDGGVIAVRAKDSKDTVSIRQIQDHLELQKKRFSLGDFGAPEHTHGQVPPGVPTMQKLADEIRYQFQKSPQGARLRISSSDPAAVEAIHQFLKFQIQEHQTGDPVTLR